MNRGSLILCITLSGMAFLGACSREAPNSRGAESASDAVPPPPTQVPAPDGPVTEAPGDASGATSPDAMPSEAAAVALVAVVDQHEIAAAEQARSKQVGGAVLDYANMLHREHSNNLQAGQALRIGGGPEANSPEVEAMKSKGRAEVATLDAKSGADYQKAYVDAMVKGHAEVVQLLDTKLIPAAKDEQVRNFLTNTRDHVAMHLERGEALQRGQ